MTATLMHYNGLIWRVYFDFILAYRDTENCQQTSAEKVYALKVKEKNYKDASLNLKDQRLWFN